MQPECFVVSRAFEHSQTPGPTPNALRGGFVSLFKSEPGNRKLQLAFSQADVKQMLELSLEFRLVPLIVCTLN